MDNETLENLGKSSRRSAAISLIGVVIFMGTFIWSALELRTTTTALQNMRKAFHADSIKDRKLFILDSLLRIDSVNLAKGNGYARRILDSLTNSEHNLKNKKNSPHVSDALTNAQNSLNVVAIYGYNVDTNVFRSANQYLIRMHYTVAYSTTLAVHTSWLANKPTVMYNVDETKPSAERIAHDLSQITGSKFTCVKNPGYFSRGYQPYTIVIHYPL
jgi:hypothetical protein